MRINFPYEQFDAIEVPNGNLAGVFGLPEVLAPAEPSSLIAEALREPIGTPPLRELAAGKTDALIVVDDIARPTPAHLIVPHVLSELTAAGIEDDAVEFMMALGTHRFMTEEEFARKLGADVASRHRVHNHDWKDPEACELMGTTAHGAEVWVNKKVRQAGLVIGIGRIMPIDISGFTGGGKILIPGTCGRVTNSEMHWTRVRVPDEQVVGRRDNPIRQSIDDMARKAGLDFIVNVIMNAREEIVGVAAGDMVEAHRAGVEKARRVHEVRIPVTPDIVVADGYPFDIEFWQVNKALDTAGLVVREGGVVIIVSPCYEGFSRTHPEMQEIGYRTTEEVIELVESGCIEDKVVGVHMIQVGRVAVEKATVILVTTGITRADVERARLNYAATPQQALEQAFSIAGEDARVAVLRNAAEMLPVIGS